MASYQQTPSRLDLLFNDSDFQYSYDSYNHSGYYPYFPAYEDTTLFLEQYFSLPRFVVAASVAALAASLNIAALVIIPNARHRVYRQHIYHMLFMNLALTNVLACLFQLLSNNSFYFFEKQIFAALMRGVSECRIFSYVMPAAFLSNAVGTVSTLTMLGFGVVQYVAICRPLHHSSIVRKTRVLVYTGVSWFASLVCAAVPLAYVGVISRRECDEQLLKKITDVVVVGSKVSVGIVAAIYCIIVAICVRIYLEIRTIKRRLSSHRHENVNTERRAFVTTVILLVTFTIFFIPYTVMYLLSLRSSSSFEMSNSGFIFYMNVLPYLKFLSDPIIYGIRMRGLRAACARIVGCHKCACTRRQKFHQPVTSQSSYPTTNYSLHPITTTV